MIHSDLGPGSFPKKTGDFAMPVSSSLISWSCVCVLVALFTRSAVRLLTDRQRADAVVPGCGRTSRVGEVTHGAMALGMAAMLMPSGVPGAALVVFFSANTAIVAGWWALRVTRSASARRRGIASPCLPAHSLEAHHVVVGLAMITMAVRPSEAMHMAGMAGTQLGGLPLGVGVLSLMYVWIAVLLLGIGMSRVVHRQPVLTSANTAAVLGAPVTVYACELVMTLVMGLMLLG
jgi:hypothetical protein